MTGLGIPSAWHSMTTFCPGLTRITESDSFPLKNSLWPVTSAVRHNELRRKAAANGWVWRPIWQIDGALAKSGEKAVGNFAFKVDFLWRPPFCCFNSPASLNTFARTILSARLQIDRPTRRLNPVPTDRPTRIVSLWRLRLRLLELTDNGYFK